MTCIIGIIKNKRGYMVSDSLASNAVIGEEIKNCKMFKYENILIGFAGNLALPQIVKSNCNKIFKNVPEKLDLEYVQMKLAPAIKDAAKDILSLDELKKSAFIVMDNESIFKVQECRDALEIPNAYKAIGSGAFFAEPILDFCYDTIDVERDYERLMSCVSSHDIHVGGPTNIIMTDRTDYGYYCWEPIDDSKGTAYVGCILLENANSDIEIEIKNNLVSTAFNKDFDSKSHKFRFIISCDKAFNPSLVKIEYAYDKIVII